MVYQFKIAFNNFTNYCEIVSFFVLDFSFNLFFIKPYEILLTAALGPLAWLT